jgi:hypothetical protein
MIAALVYPATGRISHLFAPGSSDEYPNGSFQGELQICWDTENVFGDALVGSYIEMYKWNGTTFVERAVKPGPFYVYSWDNDTWSFDPSAFWVKVRADRDFKISVCDWTQAADSPLTDSKKAEWVTYRQALRDVPTTNSSVTSLDAVTWPTQPV